MKIEEGAVTSESNGYGFVRYDTLEESQKAIEEAHDKLKIGTEVVKVEAYNKNFKNQTKFNNLYVKEFPKDWTELDLKNHFHKYGELGSVKIMNDEEGNSKGFGFVCFETFEAAEEAIKENGKIVEGTPIYVAR